MEEEKENGEEEEAEKKEDKEEEETSSCVGVVLMKFVKRISFHRRCFHLRWPSSKHGAIDTISLCGTISLFLPLSLFLSPSFDSVSRACVLFCTLSLLSLSLH